MKKEYVLGFAFSKDKNHVVLIEKQRPDWQKGSFNGVGGKMEKDESCYDAMVREFKEETGVDTVIENWHRFAVMTFNNDIMGGGAAVYCFRMSSDDIFKCKTIEEEEIHILSVSGPSFLGHDKLIDKRCLKNLMVLIPMALDEDFDFCELNVL